MLTDWIYDYIGSDAGRDPACNVEPLLKSGPRGQFTSPMYNQGGTYGYNMNCHLSLSRALPELCMEHTAGDR